MASAALLAPLSRDQPGSLGKPNSGQTSAPARPLHSGWRHGAGCKWLPRPWDEYRNGGEARRNLVPIGQSNLLSQIIEDVVLCMSFFFSFHLSTSSFSLPFIKRVICNGLEIKTQTKTTHPSREVLWEGLWVALVSCLCSPVGQVGC